VDGGRHAIGSPPVEIMEKITAALAGDGSEE
jgi:hypothetical protein